MILQCAFILGAVIIQTVSPLQGDFDPGSFPPPRPKRQLFREQIPKDRPLTGNLYAEHGGFPHPGRWNDRVPAGAIVRANRNSGHHFDNPNVILTESDFGVYGSTLQHIDHEIANQQGILLESQYGSMHGAHGGFGLQQNQHGGGGGGGSGSGGIQALSQSFSAPSSNGNVGDGGLQPPTRPYTGPNSDDFGGGYSGGGYGGEGGYSGGGYGGGGGYSGDGGGYGGGSGYSGGGGYGGGSGYSDGGGGGYGGGGFGSSPGSQGGVNVAGNLNSISFGHSISHEPPKQYSSAPPPPPPPQYGGGYTEQKGHQGGSIPGPLYGPPGPPPSPPGGHFQGSPGTHFNPPPPVQADNYKMTFRPNSYADDYPSYGPPPQSHYGPQSYHPPPSTAFKAFKFKLPQFLDFHRIKKIRLRSSPLIHFNPHKFISLGPIHNKDKFRSHISWDDEESEEGGY